MSKLEATYDAYLATLKSKFGMDKLDTEVVNELTLDLTEKQSSDCKYTAARTAYLKEKFNMQGLQLESSIQRPAEVTLKEYTDGKHRAEAIEKKTLLACGSVVVNKKPTKLWIEISR